MTATETVELALKWDVVALKRLGLRRDVRAGKEELMLVANSSTLIHGERDAVLVDTFLTTEQSRTLLDWVVESGKSLTNIYVTHAHGDHFFGLAPLLERFPKARAVATPVIVEAMHQQLSPASVENFRRKLFPCQIPGRLLVAGSFRGGAAKLDVVASDSLISKASRVIMLASFSLMTMTRMEVAVADPIVTQQMFQVEHVKIESTKKFAEVEAALDAGIPQLNPAIGAALPMVRKSVRRSWRGGAELFIFLKRDHGALLQITGRPRKALQYEIGNPLTAARMTRHRIPAALYAPLRVALYENTGGGATFEYDKPSKLFGQFGNEQVTAVGRELNAELERALRRAAE